jgi:hypothetical protein
LFSAEAFCGSALHFNAEQAAAAHGEFQMLKQQGKIRFRLGVAGHGQKHPA